MAFVCAAGTKACTLEARPKVNARQLLQPTILKEKNKVVAEKGGGAIR
jgi:hypothetical protein